MKKLSPRLLSFCLVVLGVLQVAALLLASERQAQAYVDPGSGFVFLQVAGSMAAGTLYYLRHRLKRVLQMFRKTSNSAEATTKVLENQP